MLARLFAAPAARALGALSGVLLAVRLYAATVVGFGDSEALYATWAAHPQPAYLDHPGLIGIVARLIGGGAIPQPERAHVVTTIVATLVPWLVYALARVAGAERSPAAVAGIVVAVVPEIAVGLFALTPDLLLAPAWLGALAAALTGLAERAPPSSRRDGRSGSSPGSIALLGAGLLAGVAASAKVSGLLLVVALAATYAVCANGDDADARRASRSIWPWAGLSAGLVVFMPVAAYEAQTGFSMLRHRFVDTQAGAGFGVTRVAALFGGQLGYLSPIVAGLAVVVGADLVRQRRRDTASRLLFFAFAIPLLPLLVLCLWSPVAEPHWLAPPLLVLPVHAARRAASAVAPGFLKRRLVGAAIALAAMMSAAAHAWVLVPALAPLFPTAADPKVDIASELFGWPTAVDAIREQLRSAGTPFDPEGHEVVIVGPHWTVCAQIHAAIPNVRVGCATPIADDFDRWLSREAWRNADHVLFVTDNRFPTDGSDQLPRHVRSAQSRVRIFRGGRTTRIFELYLYSHQQTAARLR